MSKQIDERVVSMQFDNKHFEQNVRTSMSTLEKLKQSLNLKGASTGLENIGAAATKVNLNPLSRGVETVTAKFSALQVMGVTALANITNSAVNAGKRIASALTIEPIKTGLQEYETQINAVQTILANTSHAGTTLDDVNKALDTLNTYADKTIYNFTEMTRNIGTFTAAGVDLDTSVSAIQGIANLAAVSGSTSQQASTAMYQLSQALAAGRVSLMDWNSVVNAGMGGKVFQDALVRTSELLGTGAKEAIDTYGSFRESLTKGEWLTTEVLTETLETFTGNLSEQELLLKGYSKTQAEEILKMGKTAQDAATKVKTFSQLTDTLKESVQSGWTQTWEIVIGDFEEAKELWTGISDFLTGDEGIVNKISNARNSLLEGAMTSGWDKLIKVINEAGISTGEFEARLSEILGNKAVDELTEKYGSLKKAVKAGAVEHDVLKKALGDVKDVMVDLSGVTRELKWGDTGEDVKKVQEALVALGYELPKFGVDGLLKDETTAAIKAFQEAAGLEITGIVDPKTLDALNEACTSTSELKANIDDLIAGVTELGGRELLIEGLKNIFQALLSVLKPIGTAFRNIFPAMTSEKLYGLIEGFHEFTKKLTVSEDTLENIRKTFEGLFAVVDIIAKVVGGVLKFAFSNLVGPLGGASSGILSFTANIGDAIVGFRNFLTANDRIKTGIEYVAKALYAGAQKIKEWISAFIELPKIQNVIESVSDQLDNLQQVGLDAIEGLKIGLADGIKSIPGILFEIGKAMIQAIMDALDENSPSKEMEAVGENAIMGLINGVEGFASKLWDIIGGIGEKLIGHFKAINWNKVFAFAISASMIGILYKMADAINNVTTAFGGFGNILDELGDGIQRISKAQARKVNSEALLNMAKSIGILAIALIALSFVPWQKLLIAGAALIVLAAVLVGISVAMNKLNGAAVSINKEGFNVSGLKSGLIAIGVAVLLIAGTVALIGKLDKDEAIQGFIGLGGVIVALIAFTGIYGALVKGEDAKNIDKLGKMLKKLAWSLLILVAVIKLISFLKADEILGGIAFAAGFALFVAALSKAVKGVSGDADKIGSLILKVSIAMGLLVGVVKLISLLEYKEMGKGLIFALGFAAFVKALVWATKVTNQTQLAKIGGLMMSISASLLLMVGVCKLAGMLSIGELIKGGLVAAGFGALIIALVKITTLTTEQQMGKVAGTILSMSLAIGIMAGVAVLLGMIDTSYLAKGIIAVGMLSLLMSLMIHCAKGVEDIKGNLIVMTVAIGLMATAVAALSLIPAKDLLPAAGSMVALMASFALMIKAAGKIGNIKDVWGTLLSLTGVMLVMAGIVAILSQVENPDAAIKNSAAVAVLMTSMAISMKLIDKTGKDSLSAAKNMATMLIVVAGVGTILGIMSKFDVEASIPNAIALGILVNAMAAAMFILSKVKMGDVGSMAKSIGGLTAMVIPLSAFAAALQFIPMDSIASKKDALIVLAGVMSAMTVLMLAVSAVGALSAKMGGGMLAGLIGLTAMCALLAGLAYALDSIPMENISRNKETIMVLAGVMTVLTVLLLVTSAVGAIYMATAGIAATGLAGLLVMLGLFAGFALALNAIPMENIANNQQTIIMLTNIMGYLTELLLKVAIVGPLAVIGVAAMAGLTGLMVAIGLLAVGIGALMEKFPAVQEFLNTGIPVLVQLADGIGQMIGAFVDGIISTIAAGLPEIGTNLSKFMTNASGFIEGTKLIDESVLNGVKTIAGAILLLTAADLVQGLVAFLPNAGSFASLGTQLSQFAINALPFFTTVATVNESSMMGVKALAEALLVITAASLLERITSWVSGSTSMETFGAQLSAFGDAVVAFSSKVSGNIDENAVTAAANAGKSIAQLYDSLPKTGGWMQTMFGEANIGAFATQLTSFGTAISDFSNKVKGNIDEGAVTAAANAGKTIAELYNAIPKGGGWMQEIFGEQNLETFGTQLVAFGEAITGFSSKVNGNIDEGAVTAAANAGGIMAKLATALPKDGSVWDIFSSKDSMDFSTFGDQITAFGQAMVDFSSKVTSGFDEGATTAAVSGARKLINLFKTMSGIDVDTVDDFRDAVKSLGKAKVEKFYESFTASKAENAASAVKKILNLIKSMAGMDASGVGTFKKALKNLSTVEITSFVKAFSSAATQLAKAGTDMMNGFVKGITSGSPKATNAIKSMIDKLLTTVRTAESKFGTGGKTLMVRFTNAVKDNAKVRSAVKTAISQALSAITSAYSSFYANGKYLGAGLVSGINAKQTAAYNAGYALGQAAVRGEKDGQASNSPSKLTIQAGKWLGEGLVIGINKMGHSVYKAGYSIGEEATRSISGAISKVSDFLNSDMDTNPTIRPVLDLTDVTNGANRLNSLFSTNQSVGLLANVGAVSTSMNYRGQNGTNDDVVRAIDKLRSDISNLPVETYNLNGITYDDGSNVATAVNQLTRALKLGGRI